MHSSNASLEEAHCTTVLATIECDLTINYLHTLQNKEASQQLGALPRPGLAPGMVPYSSS
jgi:hypothetical protein